MLVNVFARRRAARGQRRALRERQQHHHERVSARAIHGRQLLLSIIPTTMVDAFARGEILQVLFISVLFGVALVSR